MNKKFLLLTLLILQIYSLSFVNPVYGERVTTKSETTTTTSKITDYQLIAPLPDPYNEGKELTSIEVGNQNPDKDSFVKYINLIFSLSIGIIAVLSVLMIIVGGLTYMISELPIEKMDGKKKMQNAITGLVIVLSSYLLLKTINPDLVNIGVFIPETKIEEVEPTEGVTATEEPEGIPKVPVHVKGAPITYGGICKEIKDPKNPCNVESLKGYFGDGASTMSQICNVESSGGDIKAESGQDKDMHGNSFSVGLFQINIIAHGDKTIEDLAKKEGKSGICKDLFNINPRDFYKQYIKDNLGKKDPITKKDIITEIDEELGLCLVWKTVKLGNKISEICFKYASEIKDMDRYEACKTFVKKPDINKSIAERLYKAKKRGGLFPWGNSADKCKLR